MLARIIIGLLACGLGYLMVRYPDVALDFIGSSEFAEKISYGGSTSLYKLIGVIIIAIGILIMTNLHEQIINGFLGLLIK